MVKKYIIKKKRYFILVLFSIFCLVVLSILIFKYIENKKALKKEEEIRQVEYLKIKDEVASFNVDTTKNFDEYGNILAVSDVFTDSGDLNLTSINQIDSCDEFRKTDIKNTNRNVLPILMYHHVGNNSNPNKNNKSDILEVEISDFDQQMKYLHENNYTTIDMPTWLHYYQCGFPAPQKTVVLTFDDGYKDFYTNAFPILKKYNLTSEAFIISGLVDKKYYMSWDDLIQLQKSNLITIGSHSVTHPNLSNLKDNALLHEINDSKTSLEDKLKISIIDFCYPMGLFNPDVEYKVRDNGYELALTTDFLRSKWSGDMYKIPRIQVSHFTSLNKFISFLN